MGLSRAFGLGALALLSCGGRSGLLGLAESNSGGVPAADGGTTAASGTGNGGATAASGTGNGGATAASGTANGGAPPFSGGAGSSDGGSPVGPWVTLNHQDPPAPHDNPFDFVGFRTAFTDVWSDDSSRALIATVTPGYRAPSSAGVQRFGDGAMLSFAIGPEHLYKPPRLAGLSLSDLWLAEDCFGLEHSDGTTWTLHAQPEAQLVWENAANDVWACSSFTSTEKLTSYQLSHWDGSVWRQIVLPTLDGFVPRGLWGRSASDTFVAGTAGTLLHWNGTSIEVRACPGVSAWNAVWGEADAIWTAGDGGALARWQGYNCTLLPTEDLLGGVRVLSDIWGSGPDNLWIVGQGGSILRWHDSALELEPSGLNEDLNAVWGHASGVVWVVGNNETLLRRTF